jgi:hypothetical protein
MDPLPEVWVTFDDGTEEYLFTFFPDEINFSVNEFVGLSREEAISLKFEKDKRYLQS